MLLEILFWLSVSALVYTQIGYPLLLWLVAKLSGNKTEPVQSTGPKPSVSLIVAAYAEEDVIASKVNNARQLDWPADRLEVIVACDGSPDATAQRARAAGADKVLELPRGGKVRAQDQAVEAARGELLAFSDANSFWGKDALRQLLAPFADSDVGYVCGRVVFVNDEGTNQEGLYWRYEMWLRANESKLASVTAGNGAIYATRRESYIEVDPVMGHDLSFPFNMVKRGWRAVFASDARAEEKMVPSIEGEFRRKRRMMSHAWPIVLSGGMLSPRGYGLGYLWMIVSHRVLRYGAPLLHATALVTSGVLALGNNLYLALFIAQLGLPVAALLARWFPARPLLVARYYVLITVSLALGLWDHLRHGTPAGWAPPEGTR